MYIVISLLLLLVSCEQKRAANVKTDKNIETYFLAFNSKGVKKLLNDIFAANKYFAFKAFSVDFVDKINKSFKIQ